MQYATSSSSSNETRKKSIIWLRCLATCMIVNSHLARLYPSALSELAFGGMFGDCLFFMISGYCLANTHDPFPKFCWKRLKRVYIPYLLFIPVLLLTGRTSGWSLPYILFPYDDYGFITCILVLYPIFYTASYLNKHSKLSYAKTVLIVVTSQLVYLLVWHDFSTGQSIICCTYVEVTSFFLSMVMGGILRQERKQKKIIPYAIAGVCLFGAYLTQSILRLSPQIEASRWLIAIAFVYCLATIMISLEDRLKIYPLVNTLASITLEIYLVNYYIIEAFQILPFPIGLLFCLISIVAVAYSFHIWFDFAMCIPVKLFGRTKR